MKIVLILNLILIFSSLALCQLVRRVPPSDLDAFSDDFDLYAVEYVPSDAWELAHQTVQQALSVVLGSAKLAVHIANSRFGVQELGMMADIYSSAGFVKNTVYDIAEIAKGNLLV